MKIRGTSAVLGIFGDPVAHSLSPPMQNEALQQAGIDAAFVPFHVRPEALGGAVEALRSLGIRGVNVTIPHKEEVLRHLDRIDPEAALIGAVNTIVNDEGRLTGYNTDGLGLLRSLAEDLEFDPAGKRVLVLGAGGASRAALVALAKAGAARIGIANRTAARAEALAKEFGAALPGTEFAVYSFGSNEYSRACSKVDLLLNTTSIGLKGESFTQIDWRELAPSALVYDMVYRRGGTELLNEARKSGRRAADGLGMLAGQGEEAFALWTGRRPPAGVMKARLLTECGK